MYEFVLFLRWEFEKEMAFQSIRVYLYECPTFTSLDFPIVLGSDVDNVSEMKWYSLGSLSVNDPLKNCLLSRYNSEVWMFMDSCFLLSQS